MDEFLISHGLLALFCLSFLASTVIPLGSEWLLVALLLKGHDPAMSVGVATLGNTLGACTTYLIGVWGAPYVIGRVLRISEKEQQKAERFYARYGSWSLLLSWMPIIGDPFCLVGGILKVGFAKFLVLVFSGKLGRYVMVSLVTLLLINH
ncbi:MAG: DedA family protein [Desulfobulbaceae bacterium]|nr:DedA family protein [Desulfobulbaceae bacterium]